MKTECCAICGLIPEVIVRVHNNIPYVDGRCYELMCFACYSVPKRWEYNNKTDAITCYRYNSPYHLHSVNELVSDGWSKSEAEFAIKAVKRTLTDTCKLAPVGGVNIFNTLYFGEYSEYNNIEISGWNDGNVRLKNM